MNISGEKTITKAEAYQFADEIKEMNTSEYDVSNRLIVSSNKDIDYLNAVDTATGIEGLYVLQFLDAESASEAYKYYDSLSYVNYVEFDVECENSLSDINSENISLRNTDTESEFEFVPDCPSTINQNIDDAIKLIEKENIATPDIRIGIIDSGIAKTKITESRLDGGYSYLEGYSEDGTDDSYGHGTKVAGTIIINSINNLKLFSIQVYDSTGCSNLSNVIAAIYLGVSENCRILNCSIGIKTAVQSTKKAFEESVNYATSKGCICVASAGNDNVNLTETNQLPASVKNSIAVGAVTQLNKLASFTNYGDGVDIYATGYGMTSYDNNGNKITNWLGTSASAPVVSSICALLVTAKPNITVDEIKQLLVETGYSFNEENQSDKDRIIADAYGCVKKLLGKELEQVDLDYTIRKNETTGCSDISFSSSTENVKIYYELGLGGLPYIPYKEMTGSSQYEYNLGDTISLSKWHMITVAAYAPGKEKKVLEFSAPTYTNDGGYRITEAS